MSYSVGQYEGEYRIPEFRGLMQGGSTINADPRYATEAYNVETINGMLQVAAERETVSETPIFAQTLARFYRRWYSGSGDKELFIAAVMGVLYVKGITESTWTQLPMPSGMIGYYQSNMWSWITYEINPEGSTAPIDVIFLSNQKDGMIMIRGDDLSVSLVDTPYKFGVITRYAERLWGGDIADEPDLLVYSAPYDPTNWEENVDIPEDGAGENRLPSWDGDSFTALVPFGDQLIAFKRHRIWRIYGTNPGEFVFKEQYGAGTAYEKTIAVCGERILMLGDDGILSYDGLNVAPFQSKMTEGIFKEIRNRENACGAWHKNRYYLALYSHLLIWDSIENEWLLYKAIFTNALLSADRLYCFDNLNRELRAWNTDSFAEGHTAINGIARDNVKWVSPWTDLGLPNAEKDSFEIYYTGEAKGSMTIRFTIETERRAKYRDVVIEPTESEPRQKKIFIGGSGRRFRLIITCEYDEEHNDPWRLINGVLIRCNIDRD